MACFFGKAWIGGVGKMMIRDFFGWRAGRNRTGQTKSKE